MAERNLDVSCIPYPVGAPAEPGGAYYEVEISPDGWEMLVIRPPGYDPHSEDDVPPEVRAARPPTLAGYVPKLRWFKGENDFRLRLIAREFGLTWDDTPPDERYQLVAEEPGPVTSEWDAWLAAYVEYWCDLEGIDPPAWVHKPNRFLNRWWTIAESEFFITEARESTPPQFAKRKIWEAEEYLVGGPRPNPYGTPLVRQ